MDVAMETISVISIVIVALLVIALKGYWIARRTRKRYLRIQSTRSVLTDQEFCNRINLDLSAIEVVSVVRSRLGNFRSFDPLKIYPEDDFYEHFELSYDDDITAFVQEMKIIKGFKGEAFPFEEIHTVADFAKATFELKKNSESELA
jgi:hypothetical protein